MEIKPQKIESFTGIILKRVFVSEVEKKYIDGLRTSGFFGGFTFFFVSGTALVVLFSGFIPYSLMNMTESMTERPIFFTISFLACCLASINGFFLLFYACYIVPLKKRKYKKILSGLGIRRKIEVNWVVAPNESH
jgi:ABC-type microcin C transport system permease subunit YejB